ncbi:MAG: tetratricopeptide repeat protein [Candidatus Omnitrophica bacterium]|nr:tetratricopeptide repeat protein [Candidatus Omnitrophota bacterium]
MCLDSENGHIISGNRYLDRKKYSRALEEFNKALDADPRNEYAYQGLGHLYLQQGKYEQALEAFRKGLRINSRNQYIHQGLGYIYLEQGSYDAAEREFEVTLRLGGDNMFARRMLGYIYKRKGKDEAAASEFIKATELYLGREENNKRPASGDGRRDWKVKLLRMPGFPDENDIGGRQLNYCLLPPLALGCLTGFLRQNGFDIDQDDLNIKIHYDNKYCDDAGDKVDISVFYDEGRILRWLREGGDGYLDSVMEAVGRKTGLSGYPVVLLSLPAFFNNSGCLMFTLALARFLKNRHNPVLVLGGANQSVELLSKYDRRDIDFVIYGDGEVALLELLGAIRQDADPGECLYSCVKEEGRFMATEVHPPLKPDFSGLPMDKYRHEGTLLLLFKFIKGCAHECVFCPESTNRLVYVLKPEKAAGYLKELQEKYNPTGFFFLSDTINISRGFLNEFCDEIIGSGTDILWTDSARADNLDRDTLFKMRRAGCIRLVFGMETASPGLLRYVDKRISLRRLEDVLRWADEAGIWTGVEIICGLPHEKERDVDETVSFLNRNKEFINSAYFNQFGLRDGSVLMRSPERFGIENIKEICQYADGEFTYFHKYGYDETGGLQWQEKKRQIIAAHKKLINNTCWQSAFPIYEFEHVLFSLYSRFADKKAVSGIFNEMLKERNYQRQQSTDHAKARY